jgi:hypothetical protein
MNNGNQTRRQSKSYGFFFVKPRRSLDADRVARQLAGMEGVDRVYVTEGDYGFLVKTKKFQFQMDEQKENEALQELVEKVSKTTGSNTRKAVSYIQYSRA